MRSGAVGFASAFVAAMLVAVLALFVAG